jgi:hypothetical protein
MNCDRCHREFDAYWDQHRREDDLVSIKKEKLCMNCAIRVRVPQSWNPNELGAQGRDEVKLKQQETARAKA